MTAPETDIGTDSALASMMVGRRAFVFGLKWESAVNAATLESEAVKSADQAGASHIGFFRRHAQFGLGKLPTDSTRRNPFTSARWNSAAAAIAGVVGGSTLAVFKLIDGRCVLIAIGPHGILPDGDLIVASVDDAWQRLEELRAGGSVWRRIYAPAEWGIPDSRPDTLQSLLARAKPSSLAPVWSVKHRKRIQIGTIGAAAVAAGLVAVVIRVMTISDAPIIATPPAPKAPVARWIPASAGLSVCAKAIRDATGLSTVPGWTAVFACDPAVGLQIEFARDSGAPISALKRFVPGATVTDDGTHASIVVPLTARLPHLSAEGGFASRAEYVAAAGELSQTLGAALTIGPGQPPLLPGEQPAAPNSPSTWQLLPWTLATRSPPEVWSAPIAGLGAIEVEKVAYAPALRAWQLQGKIYAHP
ncbi:MAG TPA: type 4b pilus protein PilO2 [Alphaproteobacteria bacterium]|nr:type 4b pilus protein PilO2 [Alphaproteobacteria bacterium]